MAAEEYGKATLPDGFIGERQAPAPGHSPTMGHGSADATGGCISAAQEQSADGVRAPSGFHRLRSPVPRELRADEMERPWSPYLPVHTVELVLHHLMGRAEGRSLRCYELLLERFGEGEAVGSGLKLNPPPPVGSMPFQNKIWQEALALARPGETSPASWTFLKSQGWNGAKRLAEKLIVDSRRARSAQLEDKSSHFETAVLNTLLRGFLDIFALSTGPSVPVFLATAQLEGFLREMDDLQGPSVAGLDMLRELLCSLGGVRCKSPFDKHRKEASKCAEPSILGPSSAAALPYHARTISDAEISLSASCIFYASPSSRPCQTLRIASMAAYASPANQYGQVPNPASQQQQQQSGPYQTSANGHNAYASTPSSTYHQGYSQPSAGQPSNGQLHGPYTIHQSPGKYSRVDSQESLSLPYTQPNAPPHAKFASYASSSSSHQSGPGYYGERPPSTTKQLSESAHTPALAAREKYIIRREAALQAGMHSESYSRFSEKVSPPVVSKKSARKCWIIIASAFLVAIIFGICVGVGVYFAQKHVTADNLAVKAGSS
ncbi:hypothetical protein BCV69DRAFT_275177 [Microstroma glucosiphilum]|uniref:Uncharacterized protein n=1 Tax=Pseudomicrostroma glucosiphilum TaxID=1684307 RepID=A0A316UFK9_9BASI|nr:hypothetical protein BCV69DRAFT_275177 [Pseudomicrostroma glucosiphilum]PWN23718.1 hypothetical protein BCV69DRAFT_275177 [Pseudomicrostroma glucosiphilum]